MSKLVRRIHAYILLSTLGAFSLYTLTERPENQPTSIHEADEQDLKVLAHIADLEQEIYSQINVSGSTSRIQLLKELCTELEEIAQDYIQLSPGTAFLGPFSSVSLVLKQRELQKRIIEIEKLIYQD